MSYVRTTTPPPPPPAPRRSGFRIFTLLLGAFLLFSLLANFVLFLIVIVVAAAAGGNNTEGPASHVEAETIRAGGSDKIAIVPVSGEVDESLTDQMFAFCEYIKKDE